MRFAWDYNEKYLKERRKDKLGFFVRPLLSYLRVWDKLAADRPDYLIANSVYTQKRIKKYYGRESEVIYPPVDAKRETQNAKRELLNRNYFLIVSRLSPYKKTVEAVEAFNKLGYPLVVIGEGSDFKKIKKMAGKNVQILGWKSDEEIQKYYSGARAFIFPSWDDFGLAPVEAMLHGVPVLALKKGGALETMIEGQTGEFFDAAAPEIIADAVRRFVENEKNYDREFIKNHAEKFGKERFRREAEELIEGMVSNFCQ
jgi:glycosyltransferase involved in cell wall biosynthesis